MPMLCRCRLPIPVIRLLLVALAAVGSVCSAAPVSCSGDAIAQAEKLLRFHFGPDDRMEIDDSAKELPPIRNPANKEQRFKVLEVWGHIDKGEYRMRFIYYADADSCTLMGQEILEHASL